LIASRKGIFILLALSTRAKLEALVAKLAPLMGGG